jgi:hypothetical protein
MALAGSTGLLGTVLFAPALFSPHSLAQPSVLSPPMQTVAIGNGINLHYSDLGKGVPAIFVHGSLSDAGYWAGQLGEIAKHYRAIAYSRRYNYPNSNPDRSGYSAVVDPEDLAATEFLNYFV